MNDISICYKLFTRRTYNAIRSLNYTVSIDCLSQLFILDGANVIVGDLNCGDIDWVNLNAPGDNIQDTLLNFAIEHGYYQLVSEPTRDTKILDLLLTNEPLSICDICINEPFSNSDHNQVTFKVFAESATATSINDAVGSTFRCWREADFDGMCSYLLAINWDHLFSVNFTAESIWSAFCDIMNTAVEQFVPVKYTKQVSKKVNVKRYPRSIKEALARKKCLWQKLRSDRDCISLKNAYKSAASKCKEMIRKYEIKQEQRVITSNNTGDFYRFINRKLSCKSGIGALRNSTGQLITDDKERANMLNTYFSSVCSQDNGDMPNVAPRVANGVRIDTLNFSRNDNRNPLILTLHKIG